MQGRNTWFTQIITTFATVRVAYPPPPFGPLMNGHASASLSKEFLVSLVPDVVPLVFVPPVAPAPPLPLPDVLIVFEPPPEVPELLEVPEEVFVCPSPEE